MLTTHHTNHQASWVCAEKAQLTHQDIKQNMDTQCQQNTHKEARYFLSISTVSTTQCASLKGVSRENPTCELQTSCVPVSRHESISFCPHLRSFMFTSICVQELELKQLTLTSCPSPLTSLVEFVKAADIKVIAALGDSLTVGGFVCVCVYLLCW